MRLLDYLKSHHTQVNHHLNAVFLSVASILLIAMQDKIAGWIVLALGVVHLWLCQPKFRQHIGLIYISLAILGITPITTDISISHMIEMGLALLFAVSIPYIVVRFLYKESVIIYPVNWQALTKPKNLAWLVIAGLLSMVVIPFYLINTQAWHNWMFDSDSISILRLFSGTNGLGIWDELFFINTVLALLRQQFSFKVANIIQAILFTSFLYELGFIGWAPFIIFPFALIQGITFVRTHSLAYVIAIHLTIDLVLFLALVHLRYPSLLNLGF